MVMALSTPSHAQQADTQSQSKPQGQQQSGTSERKEIDKSSSLLQEVVVTGIRKSLESAQAIKQDADQVVDSVTAQDIGALPDRSVSEALQRIPGVTLARTNNNRDPARLASEGGSVFIRGLSWVRSETNGRDIFSANNGRDLSFEDVSADLLAGVDVYKNPSAELIEGGIGGIVNLRTRLPFDTSQRLLAFSGDYNYADLTKKGFTSGNALFSDQWNVGDGRFGALLSASIGNVGNRTDSIQTSRYEPKQLLAPADGLPAGTTVFIPASLGWRTIDWEQKRTAIAAAFQYAPSDALTFTMQGLHAKATPKDIEYALGDYGGYGDDAALTPTYKFDSQKVMTGGTVAFQPELDTRYGESNKTTGDYSFNVRWDASDRWAFSGDVQYVTSHADVLSMTAFTEVGGFDAGGAPATGAGGFDKNGNPVTTTFDFDLRGNTPFMQLNQNPNLMLDPANYWWAAAMDHIEDNDAHSWAERLDGEFKFEENSFLDSFRFGVRATDKDAITRQTGYNWALLSHQYWGGDPTVYLTSQGVPGKTNPGLPNASTLITYPNFFRGNVNLPGVGWFPAKSLVTDNVAAYDLLRATQTGNNWRPLTAASFLTAAPAGDNINSGINNQSEQTRAAYLLLRYKHDNSFLGPYDGNIGVRVVRTSTDSTGLLAVAPITSGTPDACAAANPGNPAACTAFDAAFAFAQGGNQPGFSQGHDYTDVLPSFNLRFHLTDDLQLRFALSKAIVRPTFSQMMPYTTLSYTFKPAPDNFTPDPLTPTTGKGGNPLLNPTRAKQVDTSLEWYFAPTGSLTFAGFYKDIKDYIFLGVGEEEYTSNGVTQTFAVTRNLNGDHGKIKGFEIGYQQFYDMLPGIFSGLGLQANFTLVDSSGGRNTAINVFEQAQVDGAANRDLPLEGLSKTSYNITAMYEKHRLSARLAYNWRERYLLTTSAANINQPVWSEDYGQLDGSVFFNVTSAIKLGVQATNILNTRTYLDVGGATLAPRYSWTDTDRRIAVAVRAAF
jgi:TonB-dependent receptor